MPSNYIIGGIQETKEEQKEKLITVKGITNKIADIISKKEDTPLIVTPEKKAKTIERMNTRFHRRVNQSDDLFYADDNCTGCGICETVCSLNNIILKNSRPEWLHKCQQCLGCINYCPENAIQYGTTTLGKRRYHHPRIEPEDLGR
jgi:ferredoxin